MNAWNNSYILELADITFSMLISVSITFHLHSKLESIKHKIVFIKEFHSSPQPLLNLVSLWVYCWQTKSLNQFGMLTFYSAISCQQIKLSSLLYYSAVSQNMRYASVTLFVVFIWGNYLSLLHLYTYFDWHLSLESLWHLQLLFWIKCYYLFKVLFIKI